MEMDNEKNWYDFLKDKYYIKKSWLDMLKEREDNQEVRNVRVRRYTTDYIDIMYQVYDISDRIVNICIDCVDLDKVQKHKNIDDPYLYRIGVVNDNHN